MDVTTSTADDRVERSWFRSPAGLRLAAELATIILAKLVFLILLYFLFFALPRADTSPAALRSHLESLARSGADDRS
jgi:hypothetical protein